MSRPLTRRATARERFLGAGSVVLGIALFGCNAAFAQNSDKLPGEPNLQRLNAEQAADLEEKIHKLYARLAPSVVRIFDPSGKGGFTGVIVSSAGEILTCAHHGLAPKTKVTVELADGRKLTATILGAVKQKAGARSSYYAADVATALLDEKGDWPAARLGSSADLKPGDLCLALGYPNVYKPAQPPLLRVGRNLAPLPVGLLRTTCRIHPGDSGGPLFDVEGRVVGVHTSMESLKTGINWHSPIESFLKVRDRLRKGEAVELTEDLSAVHEARTDRGGAWEPAESLRKTLMSARASTVEVLADGKVIALGLIVQNDGWILTKRTVLTGPTGPRRLVCHLADGRKLAAQNMAQSPEHDLALLKVQGTGLSAVRWGKTRELSPGQLIVSLGTGPEPLSQGVVGALRVKNPGTTGTLPIVVKAAPAGSPGMVFSEFLPKRLEIDEARSALLAGDLITHLEDIPTPTPAEFVRVRDKLTMAPAALAGECIKLTVERDGKTRHVFLPLIEGPAPWPIPWRDARWNLRKDGFPNVFVHDGAIAHDRCCGPVVDRLGQVIGINIARADPIQTFAIPIDQVQKAVAELMADHQKNPRP